MLCMPSYLMTLHVDANEMLTQLLNNTISFSDNNVTILKPLIKTVIIIFFFECKQREIEHFISFIYVEFANGSFLLDYEIVQGVTLKRCVSVHLNK